MYVIEGRQVGEVSTGVNSVEGCSAGLCKVSLDEIQTDIVR